ncbi:MAG: hypothetical protein AUH11_14770 [Acidobacteria bacterium 13_2_20CM_57_17]|nr:MAG: hypothetical protein AUH11_14770 [Acidobacteria bacterium 13_2_20CM_57_17]OLB95721.1 MAG: hypothetical protein AUI02_03195 [Acidobacteria bacterium 13_2_20CM_2_57_12]OLE16366.1 MAG: hypothetical protein AUG83_03295 [Acidobacteria bacterium 13_1_20CM_4_57_11]
MIIIKWSKALFLSAVVVMLSAGATSLSAQSGEYAYVATTAGGVSAFTIDQATGALTQLPGSPIQGGGTPRSFRLDPKGRFAFSLISHFYTCAEFFVPQRCGVSLNQGISSYSIDASTGSLSLIPGAPFAATWLPIYLAISPDGKSVYAVDYGGDYSGNSPSLLTYSVDRESGVLTQLAGRALVQLPANNSSGSVAIDSTARFLFVTSCPPRGRGDLTCDTAPVTLLAFAIGHKGDLTLAPDSPFSIGVDPTWIATDPAGKFLYVQSGGSIYAFAIDQASGGLTAVPGSPFGFNAVGGRYWSGHGSPWSVPIYCERPGQHLCKSD